ncbi:MAG: hypothetical protein WC449_00325 [Candidatus Paceibacterota bacterium]
MENVLLKQKFPLLWYASLGLIWAWQARSFNQSSMAISPLSLILPILLLAILRSFLRQETTGVQILKSIFCAGASFVLAQAFTISSLQLSRIWRIPFRALNISDALSGNIVNFENYYFADLWLQFFIFSASYLGLLGLLSGKFSWRNTLRAGLYFAAAAFFAPAFGNFIFLITSSQLAAQIITFVCLAIFFGLATGEKRQLTIYEA